MVEWGLPELQEFEGDNRLGKTFKTISFNQYLIQIVTVWVFDWVNRHNLTSDLLIVFLILFEVLLINSYCDFRQIPWFVPYESGLLFERERFVKNDSDFLFVHGSCILWIHHLIEILFIAFFAPLFAPFDRKTTMRPFPIILDNKVDHWSWG